MGRDPDPGARRQDRRGVSGRDGVEAQVHAVGTDGQRDVDASIDEDLGASGRRRDLLRPVEPIGAFERTVS